MYRFSYRSVLLYRFIEKHEGDYISQLRVRLGFIISCAIFSGKGSTAIAVSVTGNIYDDRVTKVDVPYNDK